MTTKKKAETPAKAKVRHIETLARAWRVKLGWGAYDEKVFVDEDAEISYRTIRASVRAVLPGRQQAGNLIDAMDAAVTAAARVIRRG